MTVKVQLLRSATASKRPLGGTLLDGEMALNTATGSSGAFYKDSGGNVIKLGPALVGGTAPNTGAPAGGETGNSIGEFWFDTLNSGGNSSDALKIFNGANFVNIGTTTIGTTDVVLGSAGETAFAGLTSLESDTLIASTGPVDIQAENSVRLFGSSSTFMALRAPATVTSSTTLTLPDGDGTENQVLQTNGSGQLSWGEARSNDITDGNTSVSVSGSTNSITLETNGTDKWVIDPDGNFLSQTATQDIGAAASRVDNVYCNNLIATSITGSWAGGIVGSDLGGTGFDNAGATDGQILIANSNGVGDALFEAGTLSAGQSLSATVGAGTLAISANFAQANGVSAAGNAGVASFDTTQFGVDGNGFVTLDVVDPADGGTGLDGTASADGQLLIGGGGGYALGTLTEGEAIDITNATGAITIAVEEATAGANAGAANLGASSYDEGDFLVTNGFVQISGSRASSVVTDAGTATASNGQVALNGGTGLNTTGSGNVLTVILDDTPVSPAAYGANDTIPTFTVDQQGRLTAAANLTIAITHDQVTDFDTGVQANRLDQMAVPTAAVSFNGQQLTNVAAPSLDTDAANKGYVDSVAQGLDVKASCELATTGALPAYSYDNGTSGVGATLTATGNGALTVDSVLTVVGERILVKDELDGSDEPLAFNGIYTVTVVGDGGTQWQMTRAVDMDSADEIASAFTFVESGTLNGGNGYVCTTEDPVTVGTSPIGWDQFSGAGQVIAGNGLMKDGNTIFAVGTANRIDANPNSIDISATYVGQASLTTLGTITTGTWNGDIVGLSYGGTGVDNTTTTESHVFMGPASGAGNASFREILCEDIAPVTGGSFDGGTF